MTETPLAVITGAAQGIGRRTAHVLAANGFDLLLVDRRQPAQVEAELRDGGRRIHCVVGDLTSDAVIATVAMRAEEEFGRADVLVNNAGISFIEPAEAVAIADFRRVLDVNLVAPFALAQALGGTMRRARRGSIINVASVAGLFAVADRCAYNASKAGLINLTRTLAAEWGAYGVRSNAVCPGWVKTEMDHADQAGGAYSDGDITARVPMGRFAAPDDIAQAIAFLADPKASGFVNGQTLVVDGGWTADASWERLRLSKRPTEH